MNEELIRQCAREGAAGHHGSIGFDGRAKSFLAGEFDEVTDVLSAMHAIRLYHARHVAPLVEAATEAETTFRRYADLHAAKGTPDGDDKARRNLALAEQMRSALAALEKEDNDPAKPPRTDFRADTNLPRDGSLFRLWYLDADDCETSAPMRWSKDSGTWVETFTLEIVPGEEPTILGWEPVNRKEIANG